MSLIEIVGIQGYIQTTYLAVYPDKLLLLDAGCHSDVDKILSYITDTLNRPISQLKTVMVTHMHPDHAGGAVLLKQRTGCQIATAAAYKPWYAGVRGKISHLNDLALTYYVANRQGKSITNLWYNPILKPDIEVREGDSIPGFDDWIIVETPGHTDCDLSFWHKPTEQVYIADLFLKIKTKFVSPYLVSLPCVYRASVEKIRALKPKTVLLAHGGRAHIEDEDFDKIIKQAPEQPREMTLAQSLTIKLPQLKFARKRVDTP